MIRVVIAIALAAVAIAYPGGVREMDGVVEETPQAYKDVDAVVNVSHELGIATKVAKLVPVGVIKG